MKTGFRSTFVISWAQTEIDGLMAAPRSALGVGAGWRWQGEALRLDGAGDLLILEGALGEAELHRRAARKVRQILGRAGDIGADGFQFDDPLFELGFDVTDGYRLYTVSVIDLGPEQAPLLMFVGAVPSADKDFWVVRAQMEAAEVTRLTDQPNGVICFTPGTRIRTAGGEKLVEEICEGDRIQTRDNGMQEVLWKGEKRLSGARLYAMPELRPIRLKPGALGVDRPDEDLIVSPGHRMLVTGARARALFNTDEVLVSARDLVNDRTILRDMTLPQVTYVHLLLPRHEVVFANGLATESFHPGGEALESLEEQSRGRLIGMIPELGRDPMAYGDYARRALTRAEAAILQAA